MGNKVSLGKAAVKSGTSLIKKTKPLAERVDDIETNITLIQNQLAVEEPKPKEIRDESNLNKDGIPIDTYLIGVSRGFPYVIHVRKDDYHVGYKVFQTLSAAAEGVSGCRRSGWTFWKLLDGRTAKEVFKRK